MTNKGVMMIFTGSSILINFKKTNNLNKKEKKWP